MFFTKLRIKRSAGSPKEECVKVVSEYGKPGWDTYIDALFWTMK